MDLNIKAKLWQQMMNYAQLSLPNEVTGIGLIEHTEGSDQLYVREIFLPNQEVNPVFSQFSETGLHEIITDLIPDRIDDVEKLKFRWHSHGTGGVFFSGQDKADIEAWDGDWVVNVIINARGEWTARMDIFRPFRLENYPINLVIDYTDDEITPKLEAELKQKVSLLPLPPQKPLMKGGENQYGTQLLGPDEVI